MNQTCSSWRRRTSPIEQVVRPPVLRLLGRLDAVAHLADDGLMRPEQSGDLRRDVLGPVGRSLDRRQLGRMTRVADGDPSEGLDALSQQVDQLELLLGVLVEEEVQLVEGRACDVPVRLLVQGVQDRRIRQDLVQQAAALAADALGEADRQAAHRVEGLDLLAELGQGRARPSPI